MLDWLFFSGSINWGLYEPIYLKAYTTILKVFDKRDSFRLFDGTRTMTTVFLLVSDDYNMYGEMNVIIDCD